MAASLAKAGKVEGVDGSFRAHVQYRAADGENVHVRGPRRETAVAAQADLDAMRAAAATFFEDRNQAYEAMHVEASRLQARAVRTKDEEGPLSKAGRVFEVDGVYRAHVQYKGTTGQHANLYGPRRAEAYEAQSDLVSMRGAASAFPDDRVKAFQAMHAEARRIQERVKYARNIEAARLRRVSSLLASDSEIDSI